MWAWVLLFPQRPREPASLAVILLAKAQGPAEWEASVSRQTRPPGHQPTFQSHHEIACHRSAQDYNFALQAENLFPPPPEISYVACVVLWKINYANQ